MIPVCRPFAGEADVESFINLLRAMIEVDKGDLSISREDIQFEWIDDEAGWARDLRVWDLDGALVAAIGTWHEFGNPANTAYGEVITHPDWREPVFIDEVIQASVDAVAGLAERGVAYRLGASETQDWLIEGAARSGFDLDRTYFRMVCELPERRPAPELADGFSIRPMDGESEIEEWVATFNLAFAGHHDAPTHTVIEKQHRMGEPSYLPELDLVLVTPSGEFAGIGLNSKEVIDGGEERGWVRSIAIRPAWRGQGMGSALLKTSLNVLFDAGFRAARLSVDSDNPSTALRLYERAGFEIEFRRLLFLRDVQPT